MDSDVVEVDRILLRQWVDGLEDALQYRDVGDISRVVRFVRMEMEEELSKRAESDEDLG